MAAPSVAGDIARKAEVDAGASARATAIADEASARATADASHANSTSVHGATEVPTNSRIAMYDSAGRLKSNAPSAGNVTNIVINEHFDYHF